MRRLFLLALVAVAALCSAEAKRPNVVFILTDDQGWGDLSLHGNTNLHTPHIDSIGRAGARFERFFVQPVCSPTRAEMLTGRYHPRTGVRGVSTGQERMNADEKTISDTLRAAGYATGAFGKWHNGSQWPYHPRARGFDEYFGFTSGHWGEYFDPPLEHNGKLVRAEGYIADIFTDRALAFIERHKERPFFCYLPLNTPHSPWAVPEKYWQRWKDKPIELRGHERTERDLAETRCALAMCENIDDNVGRILAKLEELKLAENTIVLFSTDNGPNSARWNGGMKARKGSTDEGGVRVPLLVRWPGKIASGTSVREIAGAIDLPPTLAALTGTPRAGDKPLDGRDLSPLLLRGKDADWAERTLFNHHNGRVSARTQRYRLDDRGALFDMEADPGQVTDIAAREPEVAAKLRDEVAAWRREVLPAGKDDRPFPVGHREFPVTHLPARDGTPHGGVKRSSGAPNCSYFVNWKTAEGAMTWDIEVVTSGDYDVTIDYTCPEADAGSVVELSFNGASLRGKVASAWDPPLYTNQDTIPRPPAESQMKPFQPLRLGTVRLEKGRGSLTLRALEIPGGSVMDVRRITLTLKTDQ